MPFLKRPFLFLLFCFCFAVSHQAKAQNLIADWSAEDYHTCPTGLSLDPYIDTWFSMRGTPDYFHTCSPNLGPLTNPFGRQQPRSGEAILGSVTYHGNLVNAREYPGTELIEPLLVGEMYELSFWVSLANTPNANVATRVTNNLGILLLTSPWLNMDGLGPIPNFAHVNADTFITDTTNWVQISGIITADSAYRYVAFGNFFDDSLTQWEWYDVNNQNGNLAYYYFDDFCVVPLGGDCSQVLSHTVANQVKPLVKLYPNPSSNFVRVESDTPIRTVSLLDLTGKLCTQLQLSAPGRAIQVRVDGLPSSIYMAEIETEKGVLRQRLVVNP